MDPVQREKRWSEICREFRDSGMTRKAFCESNGVALSTLGYWLKRLSESKPTNETSGFIALGTVELGRQTVLRIRLGSEVVAELELPADQAVIRDVLSAAASL
jgi:hypothetical protein